MPTYPIWFPAGEAAGDDAKSGRGAFTRRFIKVDYAPPGDSEEPAATFSHSPLDITGLAVPAVKIVAGKYSQGDALLIEKLSQTGAFITGEYGGADVFSVEGDGDTWTAGYLYSQKYLQFLEQVSDPPAQIVDVSQIWVADGTDTGDAGDGFVQVHQGGNPGSDKIIQIWDWATGFAGPGAVGNWGDPIFRGPVGYDFLPADLGSGFNVLNSRGPNNDPVWLDVLGLIQFVTGGANVAFVFLSSVPIPTVVIGAVASFDPGSGSFGPTLSVPIPSVSIGTAAALAAGASYGGSSSVPIPSVSISTAVIP